MAFALLATACTSDETAEVIETQEQTQQDANAFLKLRLRAVGGSITRAEQYANGTEQEQKLDELCVIFYNAEGKYLLSSNITAQDITKTSEGQYAYAMAFSLIDNKEENLPARILTVANLDGASLAFRGLDYKQALAQINTLGETTNRKGSFIMTSSAYMKGNELVCGSDIPAEALYASLDEAMAPTATAVDIYLERMVAKVSVSNTDDIVVSVPDYNDGSLKFELLGMTLNATNKTSYYFKNIQPDYQLSWDWNSAYDHRSFWATDPNYKDNKGYDAKQYNYVTFNEAVRSRKTVEYCLENTSADTAVDIQTTTHLILVGKYTLKDVPANTDLYRWAGKLWTSADYRSVVRDRYPYYAKAADGSSYSQLPLENYAFQRVGAVGSQSAEVMVQLAGTADSVFALVKGGYVAVSLKDANTELASIQNGIKYGKGCCYYALPIQHMGKEGTVGHCGVVRNHCYNVTINEIRSLGRGIYDPGENPGEPEKDEPTPEDPDGGDPGEPIVPEPQDSDPDYYISSKIEVLDWHVISQDVDCL